MQGATGTTGMQKKSIAQATEKVFDKFVCFSVLWNVYYLLSELKQAFSLCSFSCFFTRKMM